MSQYNCPLTQLSVNLWINLAMNQLNPIKKQYVLLSIFALLSVYFHVIGMDQLLPVRPPINVQALIPIRQAL